jgi:3-oxoacyl-[acyl-carrier protein] reductase
MRDASERAIRVNRLDNKVAFITGAGSGLGQAIARRFVEEGADVIVNDVRADAAERVAEELKGHAVVFDVSDSRAVAAGFQEVREQYGRLDILVNNAGIGKDISDDEWAERQRQTLQQVAEMQAGQPVETFVDVTMYLSDELWRRMLAIHLDGTFYCTREALQIMAPQMSGAIVNMGSILGSAGGGGAPHYSAAKAGIMGLTRSLARELVVRNIRVNAIAPGYIDTPMTEPLGQIRPLIEAQTPMRRLGEPDDIAWAAVYLASDESRWVTGAELVVDGGYSAR